jgi:tetratricopeptide (TPR) repeat protein
MISLPDVTLVMFDMKCQELAKLAVEDCVKEISFADVQVYSNEPIISSKIRPTAYWTKVPEMNHKEYSEWFWYVLPHQIKTSHFIIAQWDGWIVNPELWDDAFLQYDYIGAPWWHDTFNVGNGVGLRSKRLMEYVSLHRHEFPLEGDEDNLICRVYRPALEAAGFKWAPEDVAARFSFERTRSAENAKSFMFHGVFNFPLVLQGERLAERVRLVKQNAYISEEHIKQMEHGSRPIVLDRLREGYMQPSEERQRASDAVALSEQCRNNNDFENAKQMLLGARNMDPTYSRVYHNLGTLVNKEGTYKSAITLFEKALELLPDAALTLLSLGNALWRVQKFREAKVALYRALDLIPDHFGVYHNLGLLHYALNDPHTAVKFFRRGLELKADSIGIKNDLAMAVLKSGDLLEGLKLFEVRWNGSLTKSPVWECGIPRWDGVRLDNKTLLIHREQGFGDTIQFIRFAKNVRTLYPKSRIVFASQGPLVRFLEHSKDELGLDVIFDIDDSAKLVREAREADYHIPLLSLLPTLGVSFGNLPSAAPYLRALRPSPRSARRSLNVGIVWSASPGYERSRQRSVPIEDLFPLAKIPNVQLYSLQVGHYGQELYSSAGELFIKDATSTIKDFADAADVMETMDVVISVDSGPAHLAASIGRPTFMLNPINPCWRWCYGAEPWYDVMTLFNQVDPNNWDRPIAQIGIELKKMAMENTI